MNQPVTTDKDRIENARLGYQTLVELQIAELNQNWNRIYVMIVSHSILIASIVYIINMQKPFLAGILILSFFGVLFCILWILIMRRGFLYERYYIFAARELEEKFLSDPICTLSRGEKFAAGNKNDPAIIYIRNSKTGKFIKKELVSSKIKIKHLSFVIICLFIALYLLIFAYVIAVMFGYVNPWWVGESSVPVLFIDLF